MPRTFPRPGPTTGSGSYADGVERITTAGYLVLGLIRRLGRATPYDVKQSARATDPFFALPHTQIYVQCTRLVRAGLLDEEQEQTGRRRRLLTVTPEGEQALLSWSSSGVDTPVEARDVALLKLFFWADPAVLAPQQLAMHQQTLESYREIEQHVDRLEPGPAATLRFGIAFEEMQVSFWEDLAAVTALEGTGSRPAPARP